MTQFGDKEYQAATRELLREFMEDLYESQQTLEVLCVCPL